MKKNLFGILVFILCLCVILFIIFLCLFKDGNSPDPEEGSASEIMQSSDTRVNAVMIEGLNY